MTPEEAKANGVKFPKGGSILVMMLKHNKTVPCIVLKVGKVNSTVQIKGVETKVSNDVLYINEFEDDDDEDD